MSTYVVTGVSRGIGWAFLKELSAESQNTVIGIVRNKADTEVKVAKELHGIPHISILQGDLTDYAGLKAAAEETAIITDGSLDYLIANATCLDTWSVFGGWSAVASEPTKLSAHFHKMLDTNALGNAYLYGLFMTLILKGTAKKMTVLTAVSGSVDFVKDHDIILNPVYNASKAAMNMISASFSAEYKKDGVLFLSVLTDKQQAFVYQEIGKFTRGDPNWGGPSTAEYAIKCVLSVIEKASVENGDGGTTFLIMVQSNGFEMEYA